MTKAAMLIVTVAIMALASMSINTIAGVSAEVQVTVNTDKGPVIGVQTDSYRVWKGIPFASPPIGNLRWKPTVPAPNWGPKPRPALEFAPMCPQHCVLPLGFCDSATSEDCLHVNVWSPLPSNKTQNYPVMVFFAGGGYTQGDGGVPVYYGNMFVNMSEVVLVTGSYRLGALGFMASGSVEGSFGIEDQREVLRWVAKNIANFNGNPSNITVFGESAGAMSIAVHLTSPKSTGLFHRAIMQSNPFAIEYRHRDEATKLADALSVLLNCGPSADRNLSCLLSRSADDVLNAQGKVDVWPPIFGFNLGYMMQWTPIIDAANLPMQPIDAFVAGKFQKMPIILGSNSAEGVMFVYQAMSSPVSVLEYTAALTVGFREDAAWVLAEYPVSVLANDTRKELSIVLSEYLFNCATRRVAEGIAAAGAPVYLYYYDHVLSFGKQAYGPRYSMCDDYACHGSELPLAFYSAKSVGFQFAPQEAQLARDMVTMWTNFAKTSVPSIPQGLSWPLFNTQTWGSMWLTTPAQPQFNLLQNHCDFWDRMGYDW